MARTPLNWGAVSLIGLALAVPSSAAPAVSDSNDETPVVSSEELFSIGVRLQDEGRFEDALRHYCDVMETGQRSPDLRRRIHECLRRVLQSRRYHDPSFRYLQESLDLTEALDLYADVLGKLQAVYNDRDRSTPDQLLAAGFEELDRALNDLTFLQNFLAGVPARKVAQFREMLRSAHTQATISNVREARGIVREVARAATRELGSRCTVPVVVEFLCGACNSLDEYSAYLTPDQLVQAHSHPSLDLLAFGIRLGSRDGKLLIAEVAEGSLAESQTLLRPGDRVVRINGRPVRNVRSSEVERLLRPDGRDLIELEVVDPEGGNHRRVGLPAELPSIVGSEMLKAGVGYLRMVSFKSSTPAELDEEVINLRGQGMKALILDLRGNPGGDVISAVAVAERFLSEGQIASLAGRHPSFSREFHSASGMGAWTFELIVLVDGGTASAAELLAAALKASDRALLVGEPTYGKGTLQALIRPKTNGKPDSFGAVRVTVARLIGPNHLEFDGIGLMPDFDAPRSDQLSLAIEQAELAIDVLPMGMP